MQNFTVDQGTVAKNYLEFVRGLTTNVNVCSALQYLIQFENPSVVLHVLTNIQPGQDLLIPHGFIQYEKVAKCGVAVVKAMVAIKLDVDYFQVLMNAVRLNDMELVRYMAGLFIENESDVLALARSCRSMDMAMFIIGLANNAQAAADTVLLGAVRCGVKLTRSIYPLSSPGGRFRAFREAITWAKVDVLAVFSPQYYTLGNGNRVIRNLAVDQDDHKKIYKWALANLRLREEELIYMIYDEPNFCEQNGLLTYDLVMSTLTKYVMAAPMSRVQWLYRKACELLGKKADVTQLINKIRLADPADGSTICWLMAAQL